jgi:hypothetical protein
MATPKRAAYAEGSGGLLNPIREGDFLKGADSRSASWVAAWTWKAEELDILCLLEAAML